VAVSIEGFQVSVSVILGGCLACPVPVFDIPIPYVKADFDTLVSRPISLAGVGVATMRGDNWLQYDFVVRSS
jgi:hypothetical protein